MSAVQPSIRFCVKQSTMKHITLVLFASLALLGCRGQSNTSNKSTPKATTMQKTLPTDKAPEQISNEEWRKILPADVYHIAREKGTERAFTGKFWDHKEVGTYSCAACNLPLFKSDGKFESSCGWPSFFEPIEKGSIIYAPDNSYGMQRTEVMCGRCKAHLGHVFEDGPPPTGLRYCINSVIINFEKKDEPGKLIWGSNEVGKKE